MLLKNIFKYKECLKSVTENWGGKEITFYHSQHVVTDKSKVSASTKIALHVMRLIPERREEAWHFAKCSKQRCSKLSTAKSIDWQLVNFMKFPDFSLILWSILKFNDFSSQFSNSLTFTSFPGRVYDPPTNPIKPKLKWVLLNLNKNFTLLKIFCHLIFKCVCIYNPTQIMQCIIFDKYILISKIFI